MGERALTAAMTALKRASQQEQLEAYATMEREELEVRYDTLVQRWEAIERVMQEMMAASSVSVEELDKLREEAERRYFRASAVLKKLLGNASKKADETQPINVNVQIPVVQTAIKNTWGEFKGDVLKWQSFRDRFVAAVHENDQIAPAFKFSYLKKSLAGEAANTLGEWQLTAENYTEAWARLNEVYGKTYLICRELLRQFFELPEVQEASAAGLRHMVNTTYESMRQLKAQGLPTEHWGMVIVHNLHERLDPFTARQWQLARREEMPEWEEMEQFLDRQANAMPSPMDMSESGAKLGSAGAQQTQGGACQVPAAGRNWRGEKEPCEACRGAHQLFRCEQFLELGMNARKHFVPKLSAQRSQCRRV